jgi:hypothetical protein
MADWDEREYEILFETHPPNKPTAPTTEECAALAARLPSHSPKAILSQWGDARSVVLRNTSAASDRLRSYLARQGWTGPPERFIARAPRRLANDAARSRAHRQ